MRDVKWFLEHYDPLMVHMRRGGICKKCAAWIPSEDWDWDDGENYRKHIEWHKRMEAPWTT